jgi:hypothetical protein
LGAAVKAAPLRGEQQVLRYAQDDNQKGKGKSGSFAVLRMTTREAKGKGKSGSFVVLRMTTREAKAKANSRSFAFTPASKLAGDPDALRMTTGKARAKAAES